MISARKPARVPRSDLGRAMSSAVLVVLLLVAAATAAFFYFGGEADLDVKKPDVKITSDETPK